MRDCIVRSHSVLTRTYDSEMLLMSDISLSFCLASDSFARAMLSSSCFSVLFSDFTALMRLIEMALVSADISSSINITGESL